MHTPDADRATALHMKFVAGLCLAALVAVTGWQVYAYFWPQNEVPLADIQWTAPNGEKALGELRKALGAMSPHITASTPEEIAGIGTSTMGALVGAYAALSEKGAYTPETGERIATLIASGIEARVPYEAMEASAVKTSSDTSYRGMLAYRTALQTSLSPLRLNTKYELALYNEYMETQNPAVLTEIKTAAGHYMEAADATAQVAAPADARQIHTDVVNALRQFGTTLDMVADNINNPITSLALLVSYSQAEQAMVDAFGSLDAYYASKQP